MNKAEQFVRLMFEDGQQAHKAHFVTTVYARHSATRQYGTMMAYAGTTPERAQETLNVMLDVMRTLPGTVSAEELARAKANLKAGIVIGEESCGARASSNAHDWWLDRRVRSLQEILAAVDAVSIEDVERYAREYPGDSYLSLTLGNRELS